MTALRPRFRHYIEYAIFSAVSGLVRLVPRTKLHNVGMRLGRLAYPLLGSRKKVALRNLRNAFPDRPATELERMAARSFQTVSAAFIELLAYPKFTSDDIRRIIRIENPEVIEQTAGRKSGTIFLTAHYGSWELAAQAIAVTASRVPHIIVKIQSNPLVDRTISAWRCQFGGRLVPMHAVRDVLRVLQEGGIIVLAADQAASKESYPVEFFGRMVPTFGGPAVFSLRTNSPIVLGLAVAQEDGTYQMRLHEVPSSDLTGYSEANVHELTRRHVQLTEQLIRQHPEQWMWMHKRWKHVPDRPELQIKD